MFCIVSTPFICALFAVMFFSINGYGILTFTLQHIRKNNFNTECLHNTQMNRKLQRVLIGISRFQTVEADSMK